MNFCKTLGRTINALLSYCLAIALTTSLGYAQVQDPTAPAVTPPSALGDAPDANMQPTVEALIGNAVSLSNRNYPEIEKAIQRFKNGDVEGALEFLKKAKEKYPKLPPNYITLAKLHVMAQNTQGAYNLLELQVAEDPTDPEAYLLLADQSFAGNRTAEAEALFEKAEPLVEKFDGNAKRKRDMEIRVLAGKAAVKERRGQWEDALALLNQWVETDPDNAMAHARLGVTLFRLDKSKDAFDEFSKARKLNTDLPHPYASLGQLFTQSNDMPNARKAFERAYKEDSKDPTTVRTYAEWLLQQGDLKQAQEVSTALLKLTPSAPVAVLLDGVVALMLGQNDRAEQAFNKVLSLDPGNARANDLMALLLVESDSKDDQDRALRFAEQNTKLFPQNSQANITKAYVLYKLGRMNEAQEPLQIGARGQLQTDSAYLIARIMADQGQKDKAIQALEQVLAQKQGLFVFRQQAEDLLKELKSE
ncbi:tetratricopeptide repeat protein [Bythopirellula polymerisocia]|uniref:Tetratricopeptide repeat protein n=1 Tax=Bythopirellula polymerisocia TaxID=2528003 RepID=A0A5C6CHF9_9BACT|nr:tetratricopeptide repeat protein [Bythopirellula polymerisocia]TWU23632.1 tetratricopeptide repeat protein [Bythopirellula polymerisocia]